MDQINIIWAGAGQCPTRSTDQAAGWDLYAFEDRLLIPGEQVLPIETGVRLVIPEGWEGHIRERSGMALKGVNVGAGTIDSDYRDSLKVVLRLFGTPSSTEGISIKKGMRIAQILFKRVPSVTWQQVEVEKFDQMVDRESNARKLKGFGSSGQ